MNSCQLCKIGSYNDKEGQAECQLCPQYQSTRKLGAKVKEECIGILNSLFLLSNGSIKTFQIENRYISLKLIVIFVNLLEQCPPGTMARTRMRANQKFQNSLMPFCRKCAPAFYQSDFNQNKCIQCPVGMTSPRGAISIENCFEEKRDICKINAGICGPHGICVQENGNHHLYSCLCEDGFTGKL